MQKSDLYDYGFGDVWRDVHVTGREGYHTSVVNYHKHSFYELNLILSGNVRILLEGRSEQGCENRLVLTRPHTPHYISCRPDMLYRRLYLLFTEESVAGLPEWPALSAVFGERGAVLTLTAAQTEELQGLMARIKEESSLFRRRMLIYFLLSRVAELTDRDVPHANGTPAYILKALAYLEEHYAERVVAADLAKRLNVSRTTLMTEFKRYTDSTLVEYLTQCRVKHAVALLREGRTQEDVAERCGFSDASGLVRCFKRCHGQTPRQYLLQSKK